MQAAAQGGAWKYAIKPDCDLEGEWREQRSDGDAGESTYDSDEETVSATLKLHLDLHCSNASRSETVTIPSDPIPILITENAVK